MDITMDSLTCNVTPEEFKLFHGIDRQLYVLLVRDLSLNPSESLHIMGFWLWLERGGSSNVINKILSLPLHLINTLTNEAMACLKCLDDRFPICAVKTTNIPLTHNLSKTKEISLQYLQENRVTTFHGVQKLISEVYLPALSDLLEKARRGGFQKSPAQNQVLPMPMILSAPGLSANSLVQGFSGLRIGGDAGPSQGVSKCDRTMFVTFSKGYPVSEFEVWYFFFDLLGPCVESIYMQEVGPGEQALYARVVFVKPSYIDSFMHGQNKVKFTINGKHVWMRKFVPKNGRSLP